MKRIVLGTIILTITLTACGSGSSGGPDPTATPPPTVERGETHSTEPPPATGAAEGSEKRCGDGICDGPEDADSCPEDCALEETPSTATSTGPPPSVTPASAEATSTREPLSATQLVSLPDGTTAIQGSPSTVTQTEGQTGRAKQSNLAFILDGSGSMTAQLSDSGRTKLGVAKHVLSDLVVQVPQTVNGALWIYGHRYPQQPKEKSCQDIEQVFPLGPVDGEAYVRAIRGIAAKGYTPIADSLTQAADSFPIGEDQNNTIILVSDGQETCGGDPCALAAALKKSGAEVTIHVVGYAVDEATREQLQCIAGVSGGTYRDASNADLLREALEGALELARSDTTLRLEVVGPKKQQIDARLTLYEPGTDRMVSGLNSWWDNVVSPGIYDVWVDTTPPVFYSQLELPKGSNTVIRLSAGSFEFLGGDGELIAPYQVNLRDPASGDQLGYLLDPGDEPYYVIAGTYDLSLYPDISSNDPQAVFRTTIEPLEYVALQMGAFDLHGVGGQKLRPSAVEFHDAASDAVLARFTQSEPDLYYLAPGTYRVGYTISWTCSSWSGWLENVVVQPGETTVATLGAYVFQEDGQTVSYAHTLIDASSGREVGYYCGQVDEFFAPPGTYDLQGRFEDFTAEDVTIKAGKHTLVRPH